MARERLRNGGSGKLIVPKGLKSSHYRREKRGINIVRSLIINLLVMESYTFPFLKLKEGKINYCGNTQVQEITKSTKPKICSIKVTWKTIQIL